MSVIDSENYLLSCYRYIELNPVRANMLYRPESYVWSSYCSNAWGDEEPLITPHEEYLKLGRTQDERCRYYRELFLGQLDSSDIHLIRKATYYCQLMGDDHFREKVEKILGRPVGKMKRGRPRKNVADK